MNSSQTSFTLGMRGKKDISDVSEVMSDEKRAPANSGFFGMRGKKGPLVKTIF